MRKIPTAHAVGIFYCRLLLIFRIQFVLSPTNGIFLYVSQMLVIVTLVANDVVVIITLPYVYAIFFVAEALECGNKL